MLQYHAKRHKQITMYETHVQKYHSALINACCSVIHCGPKFTNILPDNFLYFNNLFFNWGSNEN